MDQQEETLAESFVRGAAHIGGHPGFDFVERGSGVIIFPKGTTAATAWFEKAMPFNSNAPIWIMVVYNPETGYNDRKAVSYDTAVEFMYEGGEKWGLWYRNLTQTPPKPVVKWINVSMQVRHMNREIMPTVGDVKFHVAEMLRAQGWEAGNLGVEPELE